MTCPPPGPQKSIFLHRCLYVLSFGMNEAGDSGRRRGRIDGAAEAAFLEGVRAGARVEDAAVVAGFTACAFYKYGKTRPAFRNAWAAAKAEANAGARRGARGPRPGAGGATRVTYNNRRLWQRRVMPHVVFDEERQEAFLSHFSWSCDSRDAAREAGVCENTVYVHRRKDSVFAAAFQEALEQGYVRLEAEALRQRLAAQVALRAAMEEAEDGAAGAAALPPGALAEEFDRVMKLLTRWDRRCAKTGPAERRRPTERSWTFDEAMYELEKKLEVYGIRRGLLPPRDEPPIM